MRSNFLPRTPTDAWLAFFVFWFGSFAAGYWFKMGGPKPLYSYIGLITISIFYAVARGASLRSPDIYRDKWIRRFLLWLAGYVAYGVLTFLESSQSLIAQQDFITLGEMVMLGFAFSTLMISPKRVRVATSACMLLALFDVGMNILDFIHPHFSNVPGRAAGLYINPNISGMVLAMIMLCGIESVTARLRWLFVLACGLGVLVTFSRGAWILWGIAVVWLGLHSRTRNIKRKFAITTLAAALGLGFLLVVFSGALGSRLEGTPVARYLDANTLARLGVGSSSTGGESAAIRGEAAQFALQAAAQKPFFGHGCGYVDEWTFPVGPHDMYLRFLAEGGVLGLIYYLLLMVLLWRSSSGLGRILVLQIIIANFFSHNMLESPAVIVVVTFLLAHGAMQRRFEREAFPVGHAYATS